MILTATARGTKRRPRSQKPDILGFNVTVEEDGCLRVPVLSVTRFTRAKTLRVTLIDTENKRTKTRVAWPALKPGIMEGITLETI